MKESLYKRLWTKFGGRPWTYITRDSWHEQPLIWVVGLLAVGAAVGRFLGIVIFLESLGVFLVGILFGHFFWGTKWVRNQKDSTRFTLKGK